MEDSDPVLHKCTHDDLSEENQADEKVQKIVDDLAKIIKDTTGKNYPHLRAVTYKTQYGHVYFIKVDAGQNFLHIKYDQMWHFATKELKLDNILEGMNIDDPIKYF